MSKCLYYKSKDITAPSREVRPDRQVSGSRSHAIVWCSHKHSPLEQIAADQVLNSQKVLTCDGDLNQCLLTEDQLTDI